MIPCDLPPLSDDERRTIEALLRDMELRGDAATIGLGVLLRYRSRHGMDWTRSPATCAAQTARLGRLARKRYGYARWSGEIESLRDRQAERMRIVFRSLEDWDRGESDDLLEDEIESVSHETWRTESTDEDHEDNVSKRIAALKGRAAEHPYMAAEYVALLDAYMKADGHVPTIAAALGVHDRTIHYRLSALREWVAGRPADPRGRHTEPRGRYSRAHREEAARRGITPLELYRLLGRRL